MSDRAKQADIGGATLEADVARWSAEPGLAPLFATRSSEVIMLDASGERVLGTGGSGSALRAAIADADGEVRAGLRLADHVQAGQLPDRGPRLVRLRLDRRGIARPTSCLIARATREDGETVLLLAATEPLPSVRVPPELPKPSDVPPEAPPQAAAPGPTGLESEAPGGRIVWRSDAAGRIMQVSGGPADVARQLVGKAWQGLAGSGIAASADLLEALDGRRTFRSLPLVLRGPSSRSEIEIELSGAPSARPTQTFAGFSGFGLVRATRPFAEVPADAPGQAPAEEAPDEASQPAEAVDSDPPSEIAANEPSHAAASASTGDGETKPSSEAAADTSEALAAPAALPEEPVADDTVAEPETETTSGNAAPQPQGADLSTHEHAAFREIARALGARFAGDADRTPGSEPARDTERRGTVTAFPVSAAQSANAAIETAIVSALDRLPAGVLVHRDSAILYVNGRLLELTGYPDRVALAATDTLAHLIDRVPAKDDEITPDTPVSVATGDGASLALLVERSKVEWDGGPAELLLVRAAAQADQAREQIARGLLAARETTRERDAQDLLDHLEEGVATLDEAGRVLTLNQSARTILASDAREVVGGRLDELFTPEGRPAVAASLSEARERGTSEPREIAPRIDQGASPLRLRVVRLSEVNTARFCITLRPSEKPVSAPSPAAEPRSDDRADLLARLGQEIRTPLSVILNRAENVLGERHGPLGSDAYRESLREIRLSGEQVLGTLDDLVDLTQIEAGRGDLTFTDVALNDVVSGCIAQMQPQAARDRIVVRTSLSPDLRPLVADERSMRQATLAVIANAIRLTEAGGQVIVSTTTAERGEIAFRVRDTGIGMTQEEIERALAPFSRGETAGGRTGAGLGLTLTKAIVEAHRGRFLITSRKNEGTLVEMLFPPPQALSA